MEPFERAIILDREIVARLLRRIKKLEDCLMCALDYRPLSTDPFQMYVRDICPDIIEKWRSARDG